MPPGIVGGIGKIARWSKAWALCRRAPWVRKEKAGESALVREKKGGPEDTMD